MNKALYDLGLLLLKLTLGLVIIASPIWALLWFMDYDYAKSALILAVMVYVDGICARYNQRYGRSFFEGKK